VIRKILKTKLTEGIILPDRKIKKDPGNLTAGYLVFKVDKRADGWIEIRNAGNAELWALFKTVEITGKGRLYLGFTFGKPFVYFQPYRAIININETRATVRQIKRKFRFLNLDWTYRGGSKLGYFHFRSEIINLFTFLRFLYPIPKEKFIKALVFPKVYGVKLNSDHSKIPFFLIEYVLLKGKLILKEILSFITGGVLIVKQIIRHKRGKFEILGGYIPNSLFLMPKSVVIENGIKLNIETKNVWSCQTTLAISCIQGGFGKILELCK
jgi:hypothetical protein